MSALRGHACPVHAQLLDWSMPFTVHAGCHAVSALRAHMLLTQLLDWNSSIAAWSSVNFLGHFLMGAIILVSLVNPPRRPRRKEAAREAAARPDAPIKETGAAAAAAAGQSRIRVLPRPCSEGNVLWCGLGSGCHVGRRKGLGAIGWHRS